MKQTKKDFDKFTQRARNKKSPARARAALARAVAEAGVDPSRAKIRVSENDGRSARRSPAPAKDEKTAVGVLSLTQSGFGFVTPEGEVSSERDVYVPENGVGRALSGDKVEICYREYRGYAGALRTEGRIVKILSPRDPLVIGTVSFERTKRHGARFLRPFLLPDDLKLPVRPYLPDDAPVEDGDKVRVRLLRERGSVRYMECELVENFGNAFTKEANYRAILAECGIETAFSEEELAQAAENAAKIDTGARLFVEEPVLTIDGEGAKDLDDAISLVALPDGGYRLGVHIADVSSYVEEGSPLDRLAARRGCSVYFTDKVVPMLPEALSNGACSLNAGEEKRTLSAFLTLSAEGEILSCDVKKTRVVSAVRGVYSEVNRIFDGTAEKALLEKYAPVLETLRDMHGLYTVLHAKSVTRGALFLEDSDCAIPLDACGMPTDVVRVLRGDAERMIEEFMLAANEGVATFLKDRGLPCVYRVHERPSSEKRQELALYCKSLGLDAKALSRVDAKPGDYAALLLQAEEKGVLRAVSEKTLRSLEKAVYSPDPGGHFGLALPLYCHFTSPIRRYPDLATHRILHRALLDDAPQNPGRAMAAVAAEVANEGERRALAAERKIDALYKTLYLSRHLGEVFPAVVSSVASFGVFAELENTCEGLIPASDLGESTHFDEERMILLGRRRSYRVGDPILVRVEEADLLRAKVRFSQADPEE